MIDRPRTSTVTKGARLVLVLCALVSVLVFPAHSQSSVTLKIAAVVPANSSWDVGLKRLAADFERISSGRVKIVYPQSLRNASASDVIQKLNLGVDGALLDSSGLAEIYPGILAVSMPFMIRTDAEFDRVLAAVEPIISEKLSERYVVLGIAKAGWIRLFSVEPVVYPEDLAKIRVATNPAVDYQSRLFQLVGAKTVKCDMTEMLLQLNTGSVTAFYYSPISAAAIWPQIKGTVSYVSPFKVCPFLGAILLTKGSWAKVPEELKAPLKEAVRAVARDMGASTAKLDQDSLDSLKSAGLAMPAMPQDANARWNDIYKGKVLNFINEIFPKDLIDIIQSSLASARAGK